MIGDNSPRIECGGFSVQRVFVELKSANIHGILSLKELIKFLERMVKDDEITALRVIMREEINAAIVASEQRMGERISTAIVASEQRTGEKFVSLDKRIAGLSEQIT